MNVGGLQRQDSGSRGAVERIVSRLQALLGPAGTATAPGFIEARPLVLAFSGGLDSSVLLHALAGSPLRERLVAVHVHHGLQDVAKGWPAHCAAVADGLGVRFRWLRAHGGPGPAESIEAWARAARYRCLLEVARSEGACAIVTAHHADDQAETVVINLVRGSGVDGLAGIGVHTVMAGVPVLRPLLDWTRGELADLAQRWGIGWIDDPSNRDPRYLRNRIRGALARDTRDGVQGLRTALLSLARSAGHVRRQQEALARGDLAAAREAASTGADTTPCGDAAIALDRRAIADLPIARRAQLLREWLRALGLRVPTAARLAQIDAQLVAAAATYGEVLHERHWLRRYRDRIVAVPAPSTHGVSDDDPSCWPLRWSGETTVVLPGGLGALHFEPCSATDGVDAGWLMSQSLTVRALRSSDRIRVRPDGPRRTAKNLFQEQGIPRWSRTRVASLHLRERLLWSATFGMDASSDWPRGAPGVRLRWSGGGHEPGQAARADPV